MTDQIIFRILAMPHTESHFFPLLMCSHMNYSETLLDNEASVAFMFFAQVYLKWKPMICYLQKRSSDQCLKKPPQFCSFGDEEGRQRQLTDVFWTSCPLTYINIRLRRLQMRQFCFFSTFGSLSDLLWTFSCFLCTRTFLLLAMLTAKALTPSCSTLSALLGPLNKACCMLPTRTTTR